MPIMIQHGRKPNGYNTPNMNTYATPQGTQAAGLGYADAGSAELVGRYRQQQSRNNMTPYQRSYVDRFGGQTSGSGEPVVGGPPQLPSVEMRGAERKYLPQYGTNGSPEQARFIQGLPTEHGSMAIRNPKTGGIMLLGGPALENWQSGTDLGDVQHAANQREWTRAQEMLAQPGGGAAKRYAARQKEIMAKRAATMMAMRMGHMPMQQQAAAKQPVYPAAPTAAGAMNVKNPSFIADPFGMPAMVAPPPAAAVVPFGASPESYIGPSFGGAYNPYNHRRRGIGY